MGAGRAVKTHNSGSSKQTRRVARGGSDTRNGTASHSTAAKGTPGRKPGARPAPEPRPISVPPQAETVARGVAPAANTAAAKTGPVIAITWDDPKLDRRIIEGMLTDRGALVNELADAGITAAAIVRRAADLGLSEAYLRHVQTVAADLAGDRPGARRVPSSLAARDCLSCNRVFLSSGPGNRICPRCRGADAGLAQL